MGNNQRRSEGRRRVKFRCSPNVSILFSVSLFNLNTLHKHGGDMADTVQVVDMGYAGVE